MTNYIKYKSNTLILTKTNQMKLIIFLLNVLGKDIIEMVIQGILILKKK